MRNFVREQKKAAESNAQLRTANEDKTSHYSPETLQFCCHQTAHEF